MPRVFFGHLRVAWLPPCSPCKELFSILFAGPINPQSLNRLPHYSVSEDEPAEGKLPRPAAGSDTLPAEPDLPAALRAPAEPSAPAAPDRPAAPRAPAAAGSEELPAAPRVPAAASDELPAPELPATGNRAAASRPACAALLPAVGVGLGADADASAPALAAMVATLAPETPAAADSGSIREPAFCTESRSSEMTKHSHEFQTPDTHRATALPRISAQVGVMSAQGSSALPGTLDEPSSHNPATVASEPSPTDGSKQPLAINANTQNTHVGYRSNIPRGMYSNGLGDASARKRTPQSTGTATGMHCAASRL
jgi:hypothetical protein